MAADSTSAQRRRVTKPLMEKKRRARINSCLAELKRIVTEKEGTADLIEGRTSRLEKADILEMTVRFLRRSSLDSKPAGFPEVSRHSSQSSDASFSEGFRYCISQVERFLSQNRHQWTDDKNLSSAMLHLQQHLRTMEIPAYLDLSPRSTTASSSSLYSSPTTPEHSDSYSLVARTSSESFPVHNHKSYFNFVPLIVGLKNSSTVSSASSTHPTLYMTKNNIPENKDYFVQNASSAVWRPWDKAFPKNRV